ncbi:MAG: DHH family phosphoesterase [Eubacteriales bacterium]|nr:DHH family phosphoesterase [Eubacteriales bacterium]
MDRKFLRMLQPGYVPMFIVLLVFCIPGYFLGAGFGPWVGIVETVCVFVLFLVWRRLSKRRMRELMKYMDSLTLQFDTASQNAVFSIPLPMIVARMDNDELIWCNPQFAELDRKREFWFSTRLSDVLPGFDFNWLREGKTTCPEPVTIGDRVFRISGCVVNAEDPAEKGHICSLFFVDITGEHTLRRELFDSRAIVSIVQIDNYDELTKGLESGERTIFLASVDAKISHWADSAHGIFVKSERDKFIFVLEQKYFEQLGSFEILNEVRALPGSGAFPATLSVGVGRGGENLHENLVYARLALDMALSRGGDQAVVKDPHNYSFFGGRSREIEQRTRVRARVMASALCDLIGTSDRVIISGHTYSDMDAIGAAVGLSCACRKLGKQANIVINLQTTTARPLYDRLAGVPEYKDAFLSPEDAEKALTRDTLVIVVDVNRASFVDAAGLLPKAERLVVIDHHRRVADYIENPALSMHEPYASSTCELVAELLQYIVQPSDVLRAEAEAMLAGISLDTKNFTMKTGVRTFEAAAFLRRAGADTITVKQLFANDMEKNRELCEIIRTAVKYRDTIAIAFSAEETSREIGGQAADELLNIQGIQASFVIFRHAGGTQISARSLGQINVQLIMEKLGGGGSLTGAGAQLGDKPVSDTADELRAAIENYFTLV